ncbi:MAG: hypothetical protein A2X94_12795 [Bdellovibrionales bacterium GWB1_55_8]|nr:MAG: hypothetical protein A2X94_12795 [Bdellovibrionales bacterium GWB1_55_8]
MRIAVAQLDPVVGAFEANVKKLKEAYQRACTKKARLLITPELGVCGYPPHDLVERPEIFERNDRAIEDLLGATRGHSCALAVGHIAPNPSGIGRAAQNVVTILEDGKRVFRQAKTLLPTYDVFDETRYFEPASEISTWDCDGTRIAMAICEDLWAEDPALGRRLYGRNPVECYRDSLADLIISISASPYEWAKRPRRERIHADIARNLKVPLVYVNQVGATDEILFDGGSFAIDSKGVLAGRLPFFRTSFGLLETTEAGGLHWETPSSEALVQGEPEEIGVLCAGLIMGIRDYFQRTGFKSAILGLSGGIDSAVVAVLAAQALGPKNVLGIAMPSQFSSSHSMEDAQLLAAALGIRFDVKPIKFLFSVSSRELADTGGQLNPLAQENLQSRLRGLMLMTVANNTGGLVLTTGNKSELATGYCTMYGDMVGALAPIGDVLKTRVYELARYLNLAFGKPIPERSITKPPSAELRPNQTDQDSLPPYDDLDALLHEYLERNAPLEDLIGKYGPWARDVLRKVEINEYKRRQTAPVLKVSSKAFGIGRRVPIAKHWDI